MNWRFVDKIAKVLNLIWTAGPIILGLGFVLILIILGAMGKVDLPQGSEAAGNGIYWFFEYIIYPLRHILFYIFFYGPFLIVPLNIVLLTKGIKDRDTDRIALYFFASVLPTLMIIYGKQIVGALS
jgi:hypothetical protein